ncbi:MAG TPA: apolipoprotein N-acyltransferase [Micromonosporaceae bacterium]|nr:apolipoprotein N-acyltransferase [Micromonosporaceae bacterium]
MPGAAEDSAPPRPAPLPIIAGLAAAIAGGGALLASFPTVNAWWLAPIGVALIAISVHRRTLWAGLGLGGIAGLVFFVPLLHWTHIVGGIAPWLILAVAEAVYVALTGAAAAYGSPLIDRHRWLWPVAAAVLWVGQEAARDRVPFGGFPWGRLAFSQADSPALRYAALGGAPLVTFAVALSGGLVALAMWHVVDARRESRATAGAASVPVGMRSVRTRITTVGALVLGAAAIVPLGFAVPLHAPAGRPVQVAIVQGNVPRLGLEFNAQRRAVLDNHVQATLALAADVAAGRKPKPDIVIWPENSSDIDPLVADDPGNADAAAEITQAANAIGAPILVGTVLEGPGDNDRNAAIVWLPGASGGPQSGPTGRYVKQHPVPFAEYMPMRSLARMVSSRADLVVHDFLAGHEPGVLDLGGVTIGDAICFEVAYDNIVRDTVTRGAELLTVQTNNADFDAAEASQQLAMVRLRAVEHGRDSMMVSTVGISGFVDASGGVHNATGFNVAATELRQLHLGDQRTLATELGPIPEFVASGLAVVFLLGSVWVRQSIRRRTGQTPTSQPKVTAA